MKLGAYFAHSWSSLRTSILPVCSSSQILSQLSPVAAVSAAATAAFTTIPAPGMSFRKLVASARPATCTPNCASAPAESIVLTSRS